MKTTIHKSIITVLLIGLTHTIYANPPYTSSTEYIDYDLISYDAQEICDGIDNDGDGFIDEGCKTNFLNFTQLCDDRGVVLLFPVPERLEGIVINVVDETSGNTIPMEPAPEIILPGGPGERLGFKTLLPLEKGKEYTAIVTASNSGDTDSKTITSRTTLATDIPVITAVNYGASADTWIAVVNTASVGNNSFCPEKIHVELSNTTDFTNILASSAPFSRFAHGPQTFAHAIPNDYGYCNLYMRAVSSKHGTTSYFPIPSNAPGYPERCAQEICDDGIDNDDDGFVDEGCGMYLSDFNQRCDDRGVIIFDPVPQTLDELAISLVDGYGDIVGLDLSGESIINGQLIINTIAPLIKGETYTLTAIAENSGTTATRVLTSRETLATDIPMVVSSVTDTINGIFNTTVTSASIGNDISCPDEIHVELSHTSDFTSILYASPSTSRSNNEPITFNEDIPIDLAHCNVYIRAVSNKHGAGSFFHIPLESMGLSTNCVPEVCGDNRDNDGDGFVDEGCDTHFLSFIQVCDDRGSIALLPVPETLDDFIITLVDEDGNDVPLDSDKEILFPGVAGERMTINTAAPLQQGITYTASVTAKNSGVTESKTVTSRVTLPTDIPVITRVNYGANTNLWIANITSTSVGNNSFCQENLHVELSDTADFSSILFTSESINKYNDALQAFTRTAPNLSAYCTLYIRAVSDKHGAGPSFTIDATAVNNCPEANTSSSLDSNSDIGNILYPNPFTEEIRLKLDEDVQAEVRIYNIFGQLVETLNTKETEIATIGKDLAAGTYTVQVITDTKTEVSTIIKK